MQSPELPARKMGCTYSGRPKAAASLMRVCPGAVSAAGWECRAAAASPWVHSFAYGRVGSVAAVARSVRVLRDCRGREDAAMDAE